MYQAADDMLIFVVKYNNFMSVYHGIGSLFGCSLKWPFEELQFLACFFAAQVVALW